MSGRCRMTTTALLEYTVSPISKETRTGPTCLVRGVSHLSTDADSHCARINSESPKAQYRVPSVGGTKLLPNRVTSSPPSCEICGGCARSTDTSSCWNKMPLDVKSWAFKLTSTRVYPTSAAGVMQRKCVVLSNVPGTFVEAKRQRICAPVPKSFPVI